MDLIAIYIIQIIIHKRHQATVFVFSDFHQFYFPLVPRKYPTFLLEELFSIALHDFLKRCVTDSCYKTCSVYLEKEENHREHVQTKRNIYFVYAVIYSYIIVNQQLL